MGYSDCWLEPGLQQLPSRPIGTDNRPDWQVSEMGKLPG